jgi:hypothetical protein
MRNVLLGRVEAVFGNRVRIVRLFIALSVLFKQGLDDL